MKKLSIHLILFLLLLACFLLSACGHEHEYGIWTIEKTPNCTDNGEEVRVCSCGQEDRRIVAANGHSAGVWVTNQEPTCTDSGEKSQSCSVCEMVLQTEMIPAKDHTPGDWIEVSVGSCTENGSKHRLCLVCQVVLETADVPALGHLPGDWITDVEPSLGQEGSKRQTCTVCNETVATEIIPPLYDFLVIVDAGHGGKDQGASFEGVLEKDINLQVALKLKAALESLGIDVILTRDDDTYLTLEERAALANETNANFYISVHCNYYGEDLAVRGFEVYYYQDRWAKTCADAILADLAATGRVKTRNVKPEEFFVIKNTVMPAILLEMGFLTNERDRNDLCNEEYQELLAQNIAATVFKELVKTL